MRTLGKLALAAAVVLPAVLVSCKKGENDPFISLRSRKARVVGEWTVTKGEGTDVTTMTTSSPASTTTTTNNWSYDGSTWTDNETTVFTSSSFNSSSNDVTNTSKTMTETFEKDGAWKSVETITYSNGDIKTTTTTGAWNFTGGVGEIKNKEQIMVLADKVEVSNYTKSNNTTTNSVNEYTGTERPSGVYTLDELKNKEMIWKFDGSTAQGNTTTTTSGTWTLTQ